MTMLSRPLAPNGKCGLTLVVLKYRNNLFAQEQAAPSELLYVTSDSETGVHPALPISYWLWHTVLLFLMIILLSRIVNLMRITEYTYLLAVILGDRIRNFIVGLSNTSPEKISPTPQTYTVCGRQWGTVYETTPVYCTYDTVPARYVIIQLPTRECLHFRELEVYGEGKHDSLSDSSWWLLLRTFRMSVHRVLLNTWCIVFAEINWRIARVTIQT